MGWGSTYNFYPRDLSLSKLSFNNHLLDFTKYVVHPNCSDLFVDRTIWSLHLQLMWRSGGVAWSDLDLVGRKSGICLRHCLQPNNCKKYFSPLLTLKKNWHATSWMKTRGRTLKLSTATTVTVWYPTVIWTFGCAAWCGSRGKKNSLKLKETNL